MLIYNAPILLLLRAAHVTQAPLMLAEQQLKAAGRARGLDLPRWAAVPSASLALQVPGHFLFWSAYFGAVHLPHDSRWLAMAGTAGPPHS